MKILIFSLEFPPQIGGAGVVAEEYASCLTSAGHSVTVLTKAREGLSNSQLYQISSVKALSKLWFLSFRNAVDFHLYDLIVLNDVGAAYTAGLFFNKELLSKSVMLLHGSEPESVFVKPTYYRKFTFFKSIYKRALRNVYKIVAVSNFMKGKFLSYSKLTQLSNKIIVLHNFINRNIFCYKPDSLFKEKLGIPSDSCVLVTASRLVWGKGYKVKISLFKELINKVDRMLYWLIVGDGEDADEIKKMVDESGLNGNVFFLGKKSRDELAVIFSSSDLFWLLSNYEESLGLVYIEAQACGCPVLARNAAGVREVIISGQTGFLIENDKDVLSIIMSGSFFKLNRINLINHTDQFNGSELMKFVGNYSHLRGFIT
jgi:L-malate glycosyltransferase